MNTPAGAVLGIEGGATRTRALMVDGQGEVVWKGEGGPGNIHLLSDAQLRALLLRLRGPVRRPASVAIGLAGARTEGDQRRILEAAIRVWPTAQLRATNDLETALAAGRESRPPNSRTWVLVLSGTGACCFGKTASGQTAKVGGWGHILGDRGSAHEVGLGAVRLVLKELDHSGKWPPLGARIARALLLNTPEELVGWAHRAEKSDIAALAQEVFDAWNQGDRLAARVALKAVDDLARDAIACARRLSGRGRTIDFVLAGGMFAGQPRFVTRFRSVLRSAIRGCSVRVLPRESVWGAVELARECLGGASALAKSSGAPRAPLTPPRRARADLPQSPTEQRNPRSMRLHQMPLGKAVALMLQEEGRVAKALMAHRGQFARAVEWIARAFRAGGRLFYVGAGTSGRLGVLDASECPPTFGTSPAMVQGIIAGGQRALWNSVEGAEDDFEAGREAVAARGVGARDVVVGIAASGQTPFVWGALDRARQRRARTVLLCFNPRIAIPRSQRPHMVIAASVGPEVLTGSTRLKAGTATKVALNILSTLSMARLGKVHGNLMIDVSPANIKLRDRAVRIVREITGKGEEEARRALQKAGWKIKAVLGQPEFNAICGAGQARKAGWGEAD